MIHPLTRRLMTITALIALALSAGCQRGHVGATEGVPIWTGDTDKVRSSTTISTSGATASAVTGTVHARTALNAAPESFGNQQPNQVAADPNNFATEGVPIWGSDSAITGGGFAAMTIDMDWPAASIPTTLRVHITSPTIAQGKIEGEFIGATLPLLYTIAKDTPQVRLLIPTRQGGPAAPVQPVLFYVTITNARGNGITRQLTWSHQNLLEVRPQ